MAHRHAARAHPRKSSPLNRVAASARSRSAGCRHLWRGVSSGVPRATQAMREMVPQYFESEPVVVSRASSGHPDLSTTQGSRRRPHLATPSRRGSCTGPGGRR